MQKSSLRDYLQLTYAAGGHPLTQLFSQRVGAIIAWLCQLGGLSPNQVTTLAGIFITAGAWLYTVTPNNTSGFLITLFILQLAYATDCADGQLARATGRTSALGAWWDVYMDFYAINALAFALLIYLLAYPASQILSIGAVIAFTFSRNVSLFSSTTARKSKNQEASENVSFLHKVARLLIDTSMILLSIAVLRSQPDILILYLYGISILLLTHSIYVGLRVT